ncbi:MAG: phosphatidate cytidylyltransferase [Acidobacteriota bacterium]
MKRILSATVLVTVVFLVTRYLPPAAFALMIVSLTVLSVVEFGWLARRRGFAPQIWSACAGSVLITFSFFHPAIDVTETLVLMVVALSLLALVRQDSPDQKFVNLVMTLLPVLFLGVLLGFLVALRMLPGPDGHDLPFLLLLVVAAADTGAYYGGRLLGRHHLAPHLSPGKTVEGFLVGIVSAVAAAFLARAWFIYRLPARDCIILGIGLAVIGCGGDLVESALKRWVGAKDSSGLIPGHGGILDRIDALIFTAPVLFYYHLQFMRVLT